MTATVIYQVSRAPLPTGQDLIAQVSNAQIPWLPFVLLGDAGVITFAYWDPLQGFAMPGPFDWRNMRNASRGTVQSGATSATQTLDAGHPFQIGDFATHKQKSGARTDEYITYHLQVNNVVGAAVTFSASITTLAGDEMILEGEKQQLDGQLTIPAGTTFFFDDGAVVSTGGFVDCSFWPSAIGNNDDIFIVPEWEGKLYNNFANDGAFALLGYAHDTSARLISCGAHRTSGAWRKVVGYDLKSGPTYAFNGTMTQPTTPGITQIRAGVMLEHYGVASTSTAFLGNAFTDVNAVAPTGVAVGFPVADSMTSATPIGPLTFGAMEGTTGPVGQLAAKIEVSRLLLATDAL